MQKSTKIIIGIVIVSAIVAAIIIVQGKKAKASPVSEAAAIANESVFPLKNGVMNSQNVAALQKHLNGKGANLEVDGDFGALTEAALMKYYNTKEFTKTQFEQYIK